MPALLVSFDHYCIGDQVVFCPFGFDTPLFGVVCGSHTYGAPDVKDENGKRKDSVAKKKYDIELHGPAGLTTRIYNIDSQYVFAKDVYRERTKGDEFRIASLPLRKFMQHYPNHHASVIVTSEGAELLEGVTSAPNHLPVDATDTV